MMRKISAQGDFDGACFLYSAANAVAALTGRKLSNTQWHKAIQTFPFKADDFLTCLVGTESLSDRPIRLEKIVRHFCKQRASKSFTVSRKRGIETSKLLREAIKYDSVAIVAIKRGGHWVCIVDSDDSHFYISCSAEALCAGAKYKEAKSPNLGRIFNRTSTFVELEIWNEYALLVRRHNA
jgi:hypothetical protein